MSEIGERGWRECERGERREGRGEGEKKQRETLFMVEMSSSTKLLVVGDMECNISLNIFLFSGQELLLFGEMSKWVVMSPRRISNIVVSSDNFHIELTGAPWEKVVFSLSYVGHFVQMSCLMSSAGEARIDVLRGTCLPL